MKSDTLSSFGFVSETTQHHYEWLHWIVERNLPISEVDNPLTRSMSRLKPVSSKTLKADMQKVARNVGVLIEKEMSNFFGVMWDGWSHSSVHYVVIYGVFIVKGKRIIRMLAMSPFEVGNQNAEVHIEMFKAVLALYN
ncbi:hypothetical protein PC129_g572 [Phytophthora cactorum]|uniref:DUF659 domain-containing protein n=2 Tax=Phytophthora cactorum TaxID=29920 RepID=A0A329T0K4_9STRA|nr:hypothetical protein Pcac1_g6289 [Phytophthora cactorum]KAG2845368.1 hypothetical protein PC112_g1844 [Phytophthora cactorum]KAG2846495.1 hypothetical protein PC111_g1195 [Phytophthora cactorum]KAG2867564.1 hypothetical protein PC113_g1868 [Phytophthora cactorum]KAG2931380.1 hypothetical protein PC114_g2170 [Phytophthora cactorum]